MDFRVYCAMDVGPREGQEDCILVKGTVIQEKKYQDSRDFSSNDIELLAVSDGMGGLAAVAEEGFREGDREVCRCSGEEVAAVERGHV